MLIAFHTVKKTTLSGSDGKVGTVSDLLFSTDDWVVRQIVADTGNWLPGKHVLLPPNVLDRCDWQRNAIAVGLTQQQVKDSPGVDADRPVSRQMEAELLKYYNVPGYWGAAGAALSGGGPSALPLSTEMPIEQQEKIEQSLPHLRSASEVTNYSIKATDGDIGHVEDFILDDQSWVIRYIVVDTKNWFPGRKVLVAPQWIRAISWTDAKVTVSMNRQQIKDSPEYDPSTPVNRAYEEHLYDYYGKQHYWNS